MSIKHFGFRFANSLFVIVVVLALTTPALALFGPTTHQAAKRVLGEPNFISSSAVTTQKGMSAPGGVAVDPTTHKVFVADSVNNRVLRYASLYNLANGAAAEAVFGQPNFISNTATTTRHGMDEPEGVFVDAAGRLWVADTFNSRVLRFDSASAKPSGSNANAVLGQATYTTNTPAATQTGMHWPGALFVDASGHLWVADTSNSRVLRFNAAATKTNGDKADAVLGQLNFTTSTSATTAKRMAYPMGVTVDAAGRLWVGDMVGNRVLRFDSAASKPNGSPANGVLGQATFLTGTNATTRNGMFEPHGVAVDGAGRLYVADYSNNRILIFNSAAALPNGSNASFVLGQVSFTSNVSNAGGRSASSLNSPFSLFYDPHAQVLFAADQYNHRVLMYGTPTP